MIHFKARLASASLVARMVTNWGMVIGLWSMASRGRCRQGVAILALVLLWAGPVSAATYYVRTDGSNTNCDGLTNASDASTETDDCAWATIDKAAAAPVNDGDTVRVQAGTYPESVTPSIAGTLVSPITFVADGVVTFCTLTLTTGNDYLRWIGFTIDTDAGGCTKAARAVAIPNGTTTTGVEFWHVTAKDATQGGMTTGASTTRMNNWILIGNVIENIGGPGTAVAISIAGDNNLVAYNKLDTIYPDGFAITNNTNGRWLNNYAVRFSEDFGGHSDIFQAGSGTAGLSFNLFEATFHEGAGSEGDEHFMQMSNNGAGCTPSCGAMTENLFRFNVVHNTGSGSGINQASDGDISQTRMYHDTTVQTDRTGVSLTVQHAISWITAGVSGHIRNGLFYEGWGPDALDSINVVLASGGATFTSLDYNLAFDPDGDRTFSAAWLAQSNEQSNVDPQLSDVVGDDFTLGASSGAIGAAGPLTTTSGSGTGTTFSVAAGGGGFFRGPNTNIAQYGGNLTAGDPIGIGTDCRTVVSIDGDDITVDTSFSWDDADPVYYGCDTTPDIGAYPYKAGGYALTATYTPGSGTKTISPNDASLVRFVVCFDSGVPYEVDNSSPYTCAAPSGTFSARAYPRYASKTLWADATELTAGVRVRRVPE